jgi:cytochrome P450
VQVGGYTIPSDTTIFMSIFSSHHNPDVWPRSLEFIPERFLPVSCRAVGTP